MAVQSRPHRRGQIWWVDWEPGRGSEQHGRRPALIIQTNEANDLEEYDLTIVLAISTGGRNDNPLHVKVVPSAMNNLSKDSFVRCEQVLTIAKARLAGAIGRLEPRYMELIDENLRNVLDLG